MENVGNSGGKKLHISMQIRILLDLCDSCVLKRSLSVKSHKSINVQSQLQKYKVQIIHIIA
jgi:hypothetical protein